MEISVFDLKWNGLAQFLRGLHIQHVPRAAFRDESFN